jgi:hypothetical protein
LCCCWLNNRIELSRVDVFLQDLILVAFHSKRFEIFQRDVVRQASDLSQVEKMDVVTIGLQPATSVVEWVLEQDLIFRTAIARILTSTNYSVNQLFHSLAVGHTDKSTFNFRYLKNRRQRKLSMSQQIRFSMWHLHRK